MRVRKAIIPAAGLGTRFLPVTKAIPKEMLPVAFTPTIQLIVQEAVDAGIDEIVLVTARGKQAIEDHFAAAPELEARLQETQKHDLLAMVRDLSSMVRITPVFQDEPKGLGHAILCAREAVGNEPFCVLLGDDLWDANPPAIGQLIDLHQQTQSAVIGVMEVAQGQEHLYGIVSGETDGDGHFRVRGLVEKPPPGTAPSRLAIPGRYLLTPAMWPILATTEPGGGGEIQLTDGLQTFAETETLLALTLQGQRYDCGDRIGYLRANLAYAKKRPELAEAVRALCREMADS